MTGNNQVLVLGATGGIGGEVARQLRDAGWEVRKLIALLGHEHHTPPDEAVDATLGGMGCFASARSSSNRSGKAAQAVTAAMFVLALGSLLQVDKARAAPTLGIDLAAPVISRNEIVINAPLETIWRIQTDIAAWPTWRSSVSSARFDGELKAGSAFQWEEGGLQITSTIQELVPFRRIVWTGPAQGINAVHVWEFTATERGVRVRTEESWNGDVVRSNAAVLKPMLDGALHDWLTRLKTTSEANSKSIR